MTAGERGWRLQNKLDSFVTVLVWADQGLTPIGNNGKRREGFVFKCCLLKYSCGLLFQIPPSRHYITDYRYLYGEGNGTPLQCSCLETPMDRGAWRAAVHGVAKSQTRLSDFTFTFHFHVLEKEMATHSSVLAWRIPGKAELGGLLSMGSHRVGHDCSDLAAAA